VAGRGRRPAWEKGNRPIPDPPRPGSGRRWRIDSYGHPAGKSAGRAPIRPDPPFAGAREGVAGGEAERELFRADPAPRMLLARPGAYIGPLSHFRILRLSLR